jgi:hypothetical protein
MLTDFDLQRVVFVGAGGRDFQSRFRVGATDEPQHLIETVQRFVLNQLEMEFPGRLG